MLEHTPRKYEVECRVVERQVGEIGDVRLVEIRIRQHTLFEVDADDTLDPGLVVVSELLT